MARTILTAASLALIGLSALAETYKDPRQRFEFDIPAGWTAEAFGEGVKIARGGAYFLVMDGSGESGDATVRRLVSQFSSQWTRFLQLNQGAATMNGHAAAFSFNSGVNPKGVPSFLKVTVVSSEHRAFALVGSAPQKEFADLKPGFDQLERSFRIRVKQGAKPAGSHSVTGQTTNAGKVVGREVVHGGKESVAEVKALGKIFHKNKTPAPESQPAPVATRAGGWTRQRDPHGFEIEHPAGWTVQATNDMRIVTRSQDGASIVAIAPFVRGGTACRQHLAQALASSAEFPQAQITNITQRRQQPDEAVAAFTFRGGQSRGAALCSLYRGSGMVFAIAAPSNEYERQKEDLVRIVRSLSFAGASGGATTPAAHAQVRYTRFTDPREGAFFVDIPAGWRTEGGLLRRSAIDVAVGVRAMSPEGDTVMFLGDEQLMNCITAESFGGLPHPPEGGVYDSGAGTRLVVLRYQAPMVFAMNYLGQISRRWGVSGIQVRDRRDRPDLAEAGNRQAARYNANPLGASRSSTSEVSFVGQRNGRPVAGYLLVTVTATPWMNNGIYWTPAVMGYVAPVEQGRQMQEVLWHSAFSAAANPQWVSAQQKTTMATSRIFVQSSHAVDDIITKSYWSTQATNDRIFQSDSDARRGQVRLRDPDTGEEFTAAAGHNYYYRPAGGDERHIFGTDNTDRPNIDATELLIVK